MDKPNKGREPQHTPQKLGPAEARVTTALAYGPSCIGCQRHDAFTMITMVVPAGLTLEAQGSGSLDLFLDHNAAARLHSHLEGILAAEKARRIAAERVAGVPIESLVAKFFGGPAP